MYFVPKESTFLITFVFLAVEACIVYKGKVVADHLICEEGEN
jgi:hypothetical protein